MPSPKAIVAAVATVVILTAAAVPIAAADSGGGKTFPRVDRFTLTALSQTGQPMANASIIFAILPMAPNFPNPAPGQAIASAEHPIITPEADARSIHLGSRRGVTNARGAVDFVATAADRAVGNGNNDWINVQSLVLDGRGAPSAMTVTPVYLGSKADQIAEARSRLAVSQTVTVRSAGAPVVSAAGAITPNDPIYGCLSYRWVPQYVGTGAGYDWGFVRIGEIHATTDVKSHYFGYGSSSDTDIDVGYKTTIPATSVSIGGSVHVGTALGAQYRVNFPGANSHWGVEGAFYFNNFALYADCPSPTYQGKWMISPGDYNKSYGPSRQYVITQPARTSANTTIIYNNGGWSRTRSDLAKYGGAISIGGFSLGAQTGASTNAMVSYDFLGRESIHYIYGSNARPETSGKVFESNK